MEKLSICFYIPIDRIYLSKLPTRCHFLRVDQNKVIEMEEGHTLHQGLRVF